MATDAHEVRAVLAAYKQVAEALWPQLHPAMAERSRRWPTDDEATLRQDLASYLRDSSQLSSVRVFWKLGPQFVFGGCNEHFAHDAGLATAAQLVGIDDFDKRLPWKGQAAKYRSDDKKVAANGQPNLDIVERQESADGTISWVRAGKTPIRTADGQVIGVFGMYEVLDAETGRKLFGDHIRKEKGA
jgi:PAS domain-containing protein